MNVPGKVLAWLVLAIVFLPSSLLPPPAMAQEAPQPLSPEQIDQLVAPIALHPDKLLAQLLMASTYPLEVVQAARFVKENPKVQGDQLNEALKQYTWDDSVKSLVFFPPEVLTMLSDKLDWLQKLGDAFLAQQNDVMAGIQRLRARAEANGQLKSTPEQKVIVEPAAAAPPPTVAQAPPAQTTVQVAQAPPTIIKIEQPNPQVVYVPSYDPTVVYGAFPEAYPPYYPYPPGYFAAGAFTFAAGMAVGAALWSDCDWHSGGGDVNVNNSRADSVSRVHAPARVRSASKAGSVSREVDRSKARSASSPQAASEIAARRRRRPAPAASGRPVGSRVARPARSTASVVGGTRRASAIVATPAAGASIARLEQPVVVEALAAAGPAAVAVVAAVAAEEVVDDSANLVGRSRDRGRGRSVRRTRGQRPGAGAHQARRGPGRDATAGGAEARGDEGQTLRVHRGGDAGVRGCAARRRHQGAGEHPRQRGPHARLVGRSGVRSTEPREVPAGVRHGEPAHSLRHHHSAAGRPRRLAVSDPAREGRRALVVRCAAGARGDPRAAHRPQ